jgi:tRNA A37 threonylcarbamoyladenosine dehydratase
MNEPQYISDMLDRTHRALPPELVDRVRETPFAIAGLGGVGAITAELLARWGVKRFRLLDMDRYEASNLNRQIFATSKTLGCWKVDVAAERILEINPYAEIELRIRERVNNDNVRAFVQGAGMVIQNADYPSAKLFYLAAREYKVPLVNGYATVTGGRVQAFDYRRSSCSNLLDDVWQRVKLGKEKPLADRDPEEIEAFDRAHVHPTAPSLNFVTNMVGCLIVAEAVKLLTGRGNPIVYPHYLAFDLFWGRFRIRHSGSPLNPDNLRRLFSVTCSRLRRYGVSSW